MADTISSSEKPDTQASNIYILTVSTFVTISGFGFFLPFLPLYVQELGVEDLGRAALWSGVIFTASPFLAALVSPFWGALADRFGYKLMIQRALFVFVVTAALMSLTQNVGQLLACRIAQGILGGYGPLALTAASTSASRSKRGHAMGLMQSARILSGIVGPALGGVLAQFIGLRPMFIVASAASLVAFILVMLGYQTSASTTEADRTDSPSIKRISFFEFCRQPWLLVLVVSGFMTSYLERSFQPILPIYVTSLSTSNGSATALVGLIISVGAICAALSAVWMGRQSERHGPETLLALSLGAGAFACLPLALATNSWQVLGFWALLGLVTGGALTMFFTLGGHSIPEEWSGTGFGFLAGAAQAGKAIAPLISGVLGSVNLRAVFVFNAVIYASLALVLMWAKRRFRLQYG
jgi:MFS family permease